MRTLTSKQKEAIGLLQIGTFLEHLDLMLYIHMAVLLNDLFFPKTDPKSATLLAAFAFCSTYFMRPFGALIFGYVGDTIGRKPTVIITTMLMALSCMIMANLPTYSQIGITASILITLCRIVQGLSSMGESAAAEIYLTETIKPPAQYPSVSMITVASLMGSTFALGIATLVTRHGLEWRLAFWMGAGIAVIGSIARTRLRETPEFIEALAKKKKSKIEKVKTWKDKKFLQTLFAFYSIFAGFPVSFYLAYIYFNPLMKGSFGYSSSDIILHNFFLSLVGLSCATMITILSYTVHPLKIIKTRARFFILFLLFLPWLISQCTNGTHLFILQSFILLFAMGSIPAQSILIKSVGVLTRFKVTSLIHALSRALTYFFTAFGLIYLTEWFGYWGIWIVAFPTAFCFLWGVRHFEKLTHDE